MRLIDADWLSEAIHENVLVPYDDASWAKDHCLVEVEMAPTIDAVPVVRCRECRFNIPRDDDSFGCYRNFMDYHNPEDFCSYGERKEGADNEP